MARQTEKPELTEEEKTAKQRRHWEWLGRKSVDPLAKILGKLNRDPEWLARQNPALCDTILLALQESRGQRARCALREAQAAREELAARIKCLETEVAQAEK